ncbi:unnamed protein product [Bursaphelenchus okinawaensis]|uniref:Uncharacterized protein n=1 Tax=Bursaphelenchus okinawaensis TaxID=465554 RepID=A0A811KCA9_9BILA|nr:unnamed protein product [Bursaphelenchus okinawaensis]CAG9098578.1 unnamed protein product [Bursaphelenchus okinawaensis]
MVENRPKTVANRPKLTLRRREHEKRGERPQMTRETNEKPPHGNCTASWTEELGPGSAFIPTKNIFSMTPPFSPPARLFSRIVK